ncbi:hypothetical protein LguiA_032532 [Lonicera macranthoides]
MRILCRGITIPNLLYRVREDDVGKRSKIDGLGCCINLSDNWVGDFRLHCHSSLHCCFLPQRQSPLLDPSPPKRKQTQKQGKNNIPLPASQSFKINKR